MRHRVHGKQLSRNTAHRKALRRNMAASLFEHGAIRTTIVKAKQLRPFVEKLITTARKGTLQARKQIISILQDRDIVDKEGNLAEKTVVQKLMDEIAPRYATRPGGYTRIIRLSERRIGDAGETCLLQLVQEAPATGADTAKQGGSRRRRRAAKRQSAAKDQVFTAAPEAPAAEAPAAEAPAEQPEEKKE
jgi:large subunit ribosomal protein L17